jgi:hypothetical protein
MGRLSRVVIPGVPHHVTQRGNGRQRTFFEEADFPSGRFPTGNVPDMFAPALWKCRSAA